MKYTATYGLLYVIYTDCFPFFWRERERNKIPTLTVKTKLFWSSHQIPYCLNPHQRQIHLWKQANMELLQAVATKIANSDNTSHLEST